MAEVGTHITLMLIKHRLLHGSGLGSSFTLLIPKGYSLNLWRRFVYSGCKPIGEREELALMLEC